jgi:hypothetical protein
VRGSTQKERFKANLDRVAADFEAGKLPLQSTPGRFPVVTLCLDFSLSLICFYSFCCHLFLGYQIVCSKIDNHLDEKKYLEDKIMFLEANKGGVENNVVDCILQRDNTIALEHDQLKAEYKKQAVMIANLHIIADHLRHRLE